MKKLLVLLLALCFVGGFAYADPAAFAPTLSVSGNAKFNFGIDLDNAAGNGVATGITNSTDGDITLNLVPSVTDEKGAKDGEAVYGWIKLKAIKIVLDDDDGTLIKFATDGIEAKLFLGPVYANILGDSASSAKTVVSGIVQTDGGDDTMDFATLSPVATTTGADAGIANKATTVSKGIYLGLTDASIVDVKLGVNSRYSWLATSIAQTYKLDTTKTPAAVISDVTGAAAPANSSNLYTFWASVDLKAVENLTFGVKAAFESETVAASTVAEKNAAPFGLGVKAGYKIAVAEGIAITPMVAFDMAFTTATTPAVKAAPAWRLSAGAKVDLPGSKKDDWDKFGTKQDIFPGLSVQFAVDSGLDSTVTMASWMTGRNYMDMSVALFDGDLIPVLDVIFLGEVFGINRGTESQGAFGLFASGDLGQLVPYAGFQLTNLSKSGILQIGTDIKVITNTTFTLAYKSGDLTATKPGAGTIVFTTKIAY